MASVRRKPGTRFWVACYTDSTGIQRQRSTRSMNRAEAQKIADSYEGIHRKKQTEAQVRRVMADIFKEVNNEPLNHITLEQWFPTWLARIKPEVSPNTFDRYDAVAKLVVKLAPETCAKLIDRIEPKHILELRGKLFEVRSRSTTNHVMKILRMCLKTAWADGLIPENPAARVPSVRGDTKDDGRRRPFSEKEIQQLLKVADVEWRGMIFAGLYTAGQRLSDIATMTVGQVDLDAAVVKVSTDKTGRDVIVPIAAPWIRDLKRRVKGKSSGDRLFPTAYRRYVEAGNDVGRVSNSFRRLLARIGLAPKANCARAGAVEGRRKLNPLSFHSFRHTATSMLKNAGVSDSVARDIVGHESEAMSANYTHIDEQTKRAAMEKLPDITG